MGILLILNLRFIEGYGQAVLLKVDVEWNTFASAGTVDVVNGQIFSIKILKGRGKINGHSFRIESRNGIRISVSFSDVNVSSDKNATVVHIKTKQNPFSFFLRDIKSKTPVYIPQYNVVVLPGTDKRDFYAVQSDVLNKKLLTKIEQIEREPEASFEEAAKVTRDMHVPVWLGTSRDNRIFQVDESIAETGEGVANFITPKMSSSSVGIKETKMKPTTYLYAVGRGEGVYVNKTKRLEEGDLPILNTTLKDDDVVYRSTSFVAMEKSSLFDLKGRNYLVADAYSIGHSYNKKTNDELEKQKQLDNSAEDLTVLYYKLNITNQGKVPRYAWFKTPRVGGNWMDKSGFSYDNQTGYSAYDSSGNIFCISTLNGKPLPDQEIAILLQPGEEATITFALPHLPVNKERADHLAQVNIESKLDETIRFWNQKLNSAARISVPERQINERVHAGLLHLDLITYGQEPNGTLAPSIGVYSPIGSESAPIMQYYMSMGLLDEARRSLDYFLETQDDDGRLGNYAGYSLETGAVLWSVGEYYRYALDKQWIINKKDNLLKAADYLASWRNRNKKEKLRGRGYGMIEGRVADPVDPFRQFMLNAYGYLGMSRMAKVFRDVDVDLSKRYQAEADEWKKDIRETFFNLMGMSPVIPLGDGSWAPTVPPWAEADGPEALLINQGSTVWTHGMFTAADGLLGPMYLIFGEVLDPYEFASINLLRYSSELLFLGNTAHSQPYYSRHNWLQARLGMVKPFLNTYYYTVAAHADRQTYTFWEHMFRASPHKTHEEAWFLMQTRWMLYMEEADTLSLLKTIPRKWMEDGKEIDVKGARSYFGTLDIHVTSHVNDKFIEAIVQCGFTKATKIITIRLPHPEGKRPVMVTGGKYDRETETVTISPVRSGEMKIKLSY